MLRVRSPFMARCTRYTNKTDSHDITEILLKVALNSITLSNSLSLKKSNYIKTKAYVMLAGFGYPLVGYPLVCYPLVATF